jgi:hypothetical protein
LGELAALVKVYTEARFGEEFVVIEAQVLEFSQDYEKLVLLRNTVGSRCLFGFTSFKRRLGEAVVSSEENWVHLFEPLVLAFQVDDEKLSKDAAHAPHISCLAVGLSSWNYYFGWSVKPLETWAWHSPSSFVGYLFLRYDPCPSEVAQTYVAVLIHQNVRRLKVSVDDS